MTLSVSVVIPAYNHARFVEAAVQSVLRQTRAADEIVIVDDGSTDATPEVLQALVRAHPGIVHWRRPNQGAHSALNAGVQRSTGDLVAILNSDDTFEPERLETLLPAFDDPEVRCVCSGVTFTDSDGTPFQSDWYDDGIAFRQASAQLGVALAYANTVVTTSNIVARRDALIDGGGFRALRYTHDLEFLLRLTRRPGALTVVDRALVNYRWHEGNTIKESAVRMKAETILVLADHLGRLVEDGADPERLEAYLPALRRQGGVEAVLTLAPAFLRRSLATLDSEGLASRMAHVVRMLEAVT